MTSLFTARRRAEEFAALVDGNHADSRGDTELLELVGVVSSLRSHQDVTPRPDFAADLRARLMAEAETALRGEAATLRIAARPRGARERRLVAAASAAVLIGGTATMAAAAQNALPGEALYPIKRGIERAEAQLNVNAEGKGQDLLAQASGRLTEVESLVGSPLTSAPVVPETLEDFATQAHEGADLLFRAFAENQDPQAVLAVRAFAAEGIELLERLSADVPPEAQDELAAAALLLQQLDERAANLCNSCASGLPALDVPGIFLARAEVDRVLPEVVPGELNNNHPFVVRKGVPSKKPAAKDEGTSKETERRPGAQSTTQPKPTAQPSQQPSAQPSSRPETPEEWQPENWPTLLPGASVPAGTQRDLSELPSEIVQDLTGGLSGVVETVLPDAIADEDLLR